MTRAFEADPPVFQYSITPIIPILSDTRTQTAINVVFD
jgi:hypothetical protein